MKNPQDQVLLTLRQVQSYMDTNAAALGDLNTNGARANLDATVTALTNLAVTQDTSKVQGQGETTKQSSLRNDLLKTQMAPIAAVAKVKLSSVPEFSALKLPSTKASSQTLITAAAAMGNAAAPYTSVFTDMGLPATFLTTLAAAATDLQNSLDGRNAFKVTRVGATAGADDLVRTARQQLKVLNTQISPMVASNSQLLGAWNTARKILKKPGVTIGTTRPPTPTPTPASTPELAPIPTLAAKEAA